MMLQKENQRIKFAYHEIELTRRCNSKCAHCMRGKAQAKDISEEHLDLFFEKTEYIHVLTLTGGEVSLVPKVMNQALEAAKRHGTVIDHAGIITNGLYVSDAFIQAAKDWKDYSAGFGLEVSWDPYHKPVSSENFSRLQRIEYDVPPRSNFALQPSGRAEDLSSALVIPKGIDKPYWILNGWVMQPTYLNALGDFVIIDGSYDEQPDFKIGNVYDMCYDTFINIHPRAFEALASPFGIGPPRWNEDTMVDFLKQGSPGINVIRFNPFPTLVEKVIGAEESLKLAEG
jgi:hypothetical protein